MDSGAWEGNRGRRARKMAKKMVLWRKLAGNLAEACWSCGFAVPNVGVGSFEGWRGGFGPAIEVEEDVRPFFCSCLRFVPFFFLITFTPIFLG